MIIFLSSGPKKTLFLPFVELFGIIQQCSSPRKLYKTPIFSYFMETKTKRKETNSNANGTEELKLGKNIILVGFSLEPVEMIVVKKIVGHYAKKISEKVAYEDLKINLRKIEKAKTFLHEIEASAKTNKGILAANATNNNLYTALSGALEKIYSEAEHKERTARQEK